MFPIFVPESAPRSRRTGIKFVILGLLVALGFGVLLFVRPTLGASPWIMIMVGAAVVIFIPLAMLLVRRSDEDGAAKGKRGMEGLDLYSVIDRLVDDIDDDEAAYLQRRLDERQAKNKDDLTVALDDLLEQRTRGREPSQE